MTTVRIRLDNTRTLVYLSTLLILRNSKNDTRNADDTQQNHALTGMGVVSLP